MKNLLIALVFIIGLSAYAEKVRHFDSDKKPLPAGKVGTYQLTTQTEQEWNDSGCPPNVKWVGDVPSLKSEVEKKAERDAEEVTHKAKQKDDFDKTELGKRLKDIEARLDKLEKK